MVAELIDVGELGLTLEQIADALAEDALPLAPMNETTWWHSRTRCSGGVAESSRSANGRMDKKSSAKTVIPIGPALTTASALRSLW